MRLRPSCVAAITGFAGFVVEAGLEGHRRTIRPDPSRAVGRADTALGLPRRAEVVGRVIAVVVELVANLVVTREGQRIVGFAVVRTVTLEIVVAGVAEVIAIEIGLIGVDDKLTTVSIVGHAIVVVAGVAFAVIISIELVGVRKVGAIVCDVRRSVVVSRAVGDSVVV